MSNQQHEEKPIVIVDENNNVIGSRQRVEAVREGLWHRIVVVLVFNGKGEMFIQKRSANAPSSPNLWDHSAAGHVDEGEEPVDAAKRELVEELGIQAEDFEYLSSYKTQRSVDDKHYNRFWYVYSCKFDGEVHLDQTEVADGRFVDVQWLREDLAQHPEMYTDGIEKSLGAYLHSSQTNQ